MVYRRKNPLFVGRRIRIVYGEVPKSVGILERKFIDEIGIIKEVRDLFSTLPYIVHVPSLDEGIELNISEIKAINK